MSCNFIIFNINVNYKLFIYTACHTAKKAGGKTGLQHYSFSKLAHSVSLSFWAVVFTFFETLMLSRLHIGSVLAWNLHSVTLQPIDLLAFMLVLTSNNTLKFCCNHIIG